MINLWPSTLCRRAWLVHIVAALASGPYKPSEATYKMLEFSVWRVGLSLILPAKILFLENLFLTGVKGIEVALRASTDCEEMGWLSFIFGGATGHFNILD